MRFSFIHTADWQIGKPFRNFPERVAGRLEGARLDAIDRLAAAARARGIGHVLVAGDIWDSDRLPSREEQQPLKRMAAYAELTWVLIPGNHDAARAGSVWTRLAVRGAPSNVIALTESRPFEVVPGVVVLPAPLTSRSAGRDPTHWMDGVATAPGLLRIGLAHGSVKGFGSEGGQDGLIDAARAKRAGLDYLALGDWHGATRINARTWYSGTPEPDRFKDNEPGEVLAVTIGGQGAEPAVERIATGHYVWVAVEADVSEVAGLARIERDLRARGTALNRMIVRIMLGGRLPPADLYRVEAWRDALASEVEHLACDASRIGVAGGAVDLDLFGAAGELRRVAEILSARACDPQDPRAADAAEGLKRLVGILADVRSRSGGDVLSGERRPAGRGGAS